MAKGNIVKTLEPLYREAFAGRRPPEDLDLEVTYQCYIEQPPQSYYLAICGDSLQFGEGEHQTPTLTLRFHSVETVRGLLCGELDPIQTFLKGELTADSHLLLAMRYFMLFANIPPHADLS